MAETIAEKNILYRLLIDDSNLTVSAKRATAATSTLDKEIEKVSKTSKKAAQESKKAVETEESAAKKRAVLIKAEERSIQRLTAARKKAYNPSDIQSYNAAISESQKRIRLLKGETDKLSGSTNSLTSILGKAGIAFSAYQVLGGLKDYVSDSIKLANQTRNVRNAFNQLPNATRIMNDLRAATSGTVDDLALMQGAIRADKFRVPLEQLATFFKFATDRAAETGQEVDYLVNSIVDGIGRKSSLVLDNLGISAAEIQEEFQKTGDFGAAAANIIARQMKDANVVVDEGARAAARYEAASKNLQTVLGEVIEDFIGINSISGQLSERWQDIADAIERSRSEGRKLNEETANIPKTVDDYVRAVNNLATTLIDRQERLARINNNQEAATTDQIAALKAEILAITGVLDRYRESLKNFKTEQEEAGKSSEFNGRNLAFLNAEIKRLTEVQNDAATSTEEIRKINAQLNALYKEQDALLGRLKDDVDEVAEAFNRWEQELKDSNDASIQLLSSKDAWDKFYSDLEEDAKRATDAQRTLNDVLFNVPDEPSGAAIGEPDFEDLKKGEDERVEIYRASAAAIASIYTSLANYQQSLYQTDLQNLEAQLNSKVITEQQYAARVAQIKRKQAQNEKSVATFEAIVNGAVAVVNALKDGGPALAAIVGIAAAAEVATIAAQPIPQFAKGVIDLQGPGTGTSDDIPAWLSKGESVMTAKETGKYRDVFEAIRADKFEDFAKENYIQPALAIQQIEYDRGGAKSPEPYNDYRLRKAVHENRNVGVRNADDIGRAVAKHLNGAAWRKGYMR